MLVGVPMLVWIFPGRPSKPSRFVEFCALMISHIARNANVISLISLITRCVLFRLSIPTSPTQISTHFRVSLPSRRQGEHNNPPTLYLRYFGTHKGQKNSNMFIFHFSPQTYLCRGPKVPFRLGREDADSGETSPTECGLPDADKGSRAGTIQHIRDVFGRESFLFILSFLYHQHA